MRTGEKMRITKATSAAVLAAVVLALAAAGAAQAQARRSIEQILNDPVLKQSTVALLAKDLRTGQTLINLNADRKMIPASNMKLVTGAAAMLELGPGFKFHTDFMTKNFNPSTGLSDGIYVKGYGDPSISDRFFASAGEAMDAHAAQLKKNGFKGFSGVLWLDGSFMDNMRPASWPQEDLSWCYAPRPGALSAAGNCARVTVSAGASTAKATIDPPVHPSFLRVSLKATTGNTSVKVSQDDKGVITVSGSVKKNTTAKYEHTVRKPTLLYGAALLGAMKRAGMKVSADMRETSDLPPGYLGFARAVSPDLAAVTAQMEKHSDNFIAEQIVRTIGGLRGAPDAPGAAAVVKDIMVRANMAAASELTVVDGSGLSRENRLAPKVLLTLLSSFYNFNPGRPFQDMLAEPGVKGTLEKRLVNTSAAGRLKAKTGALRGACSLSGYIRPVYGGSVAFVMIMNGYSVHSNQIRALQDELVLALVEM